ncbi:MAG: hypothetical protein MJ231_05380, partial [bacterium]|nr:hypothetical protein [bacterium]
KLKLYESINLGRKLSIFRNFSANPLKVIEENKKYLKRLGIEINTDEISKLPINEQEKKITEILKEKLPEGEKLKLYIKPRGYEETIYHEMGHLQDFAKNLKELDLENWQFWDVWGNMKNALKGIKNKDTAGIEAIGNHWGGTTYKGYKELLKKDPEMFKSLYPDLYEHLTNKEVQKTAGKVSAYAQTSIGEFIAETYAKMISGDKIPEDVLKLYKKYNGPLPKAFA